MVEIEESDSEGMWVFGYGSLIWRPDFPVEKSVFGYVEGYVRRFWQKSHDHRGTPEEPGRVVTLIPYDVWKTMNDEERKSSSQCWGVALKVRSGMEVEVKAYLDNRESDGYSVHYVPVFGKGSQAPLVKRAIVYIGSVDNPSFAGPTPVESVASIVKYSVGPSGPNLDYLVNLIVALRANDPSSVDDHLESIVIHLGISV